MTKLNLNILFATLCHEMGLNSFKQCFFFLLSGFRRILGIILAKLVQSLLHTYLCEAQTLVCLGFQKRQFFSRVAISDLYGAASNFCSASRQLSLRLRLNITFLLFWASTTTTSPSAYSADVTPSAYSRLRTPLYKMFPDIGPRTDPSGTPASYPVSIYLM